MKVIPFTLPVQQDRSVSVQEERLPHFYPHLHRHEECQITVVLQGEGTLVTGSQMRPFKPGDLFLIGANQPHLFKSDPVYFEKRRNKRVHALTVFFNPAGKLSALFQLPELKNLFRWLQAAPGGWQASPALARALRAKMHDLQRTRGAGRIQLFLEIMQRMAASRSLQPLATSAHQIPFSEAEGQRLNQIYRFSLQHFTEPISLADIASVAHFSVPAFCRYFKKRTGKTYFRFLNELRISEACRILMNDPAETMAQVAAACGFGNVSHFNRTFRQITGFSPRLYKARTLPLAP